MTHSHIDLRNRNDIYTTCLNGFNCGSSSRTNYITGSVDFDLVSVMKPTSPALTTSKPPAVSKSITVNGEPALISLHSTPELAESPYLPLIRSVINAAYRAGSFNGPLEYLPASVVRLNSETQLLDEIGPDAFTILVNSSMEHPAGLQVYASASARPFTGLADAGHMDEAVRTFKRSAPIAPMDPNIEQWELLLMAVDVSLQKQGIAGKLMGMVEDEIRRRSSGNGREVHVILSTMKERNFEYYRKKGYVLTAEKKFGKGVHGSRDGFTVAEMMKKLES